MGDQNDVTPTNRGDDVNKLFSDQPTFVNYGRVFLDVVMTCVLTAVVINEIGTNQTDGRKQLSVHEVPIYFKHGMMQGDLWEHVMSDKTLKNDPERVDKFKRDMNKTCAPIHGHPLCVCIRNVNSSIADCKDCMLQNPQPSVLSDWNIGSVASAMMIWFIASLATSVGTLPYIQTWISFSPSQDGTSVKIMEYLRPVVYTYIFLTLCVIAVPLILTAVMFKGDDSKKHMECVGMMLLYGIVAILTIGSYNLKTVRRYMGYTMVPHTAQTEENADKTLEKPVDSFHKMSVNNFILYVHLLVSAPAIAMIIHLTQKWTEVSSITNTTLVLSTIFAVDGFSAEMANYWSHHTASEYSKRKSRLTEFALHQTDEEKKQEIDDMHTRLGIIRMFAWVINFVMIVLLFSLAYPIEVEQQKTNSAIFVVVVVLYGAVFLAPDLVREFTQRMSFNSIQFRLYGDFVVRGMALFFVWRASVYERV
jgi:hypothetical protein